MNPQETCRTCLGLNKAMRSIYTVNVAKVGFKHITAIDVLHMFTDIMICKDDGFPDQICTDCLEELQQMYSFKLKCEKSNSVLMGLHLKEPNVIQIDDETNIKLPQLPYTIEQRVLAVQVFYESNQSIVTTTRKLHKIFGAYNAPCKRSIQALIAKFKKSGSICDVPISVHDHKRFITKNIGWIEQSVSGDKSISTTEHPEIETRQCDSEIRNECLKEMDKIEIIENQSEGVSFIVKYMKFADEQEPVPVESSVRSKYPNIKIKREVEHDMNCIIKEPELNRTEKDLNLINLEGNYSAFKSFECFDCHYKSSYPNQLEKHIIDRHMQQRWCKICKTEFECPIQHCAKHLSPQASKAIDTKHYQCLKCFKSFKSQDTYQEHMQVHSRRFECGICFDSFSFEFGLKHHLKRKHKPSNSLSDLCSESFESKISPIKHLKSDSDKGYYKCEFCSNVFSLFGNLTQHLKDKHRDESKKEMPSQSEILSKRIRLT